MCAVTIPEGPGRGGDGMSDFDRFVGVWELDGIEDFLEGKRGPPAGFERSSGLLFLPADGRDVRQFRGLLAAALSQRILADSIRAGRRGIGVWRVRRPLGS